MICAHDNQILYNRLASRRGSDFSADRVREINVHRQAHRRSLSRRYRTRGVEPARLLFFDDAPANVEAARLAGFQAEVFVNESGLLQTLAVRGLLN